MKRDYLNIGVEKIDGKMVAIATDQTLDRHGEKLSIKLWDLKNYKKNPVLQAGHDYKPESTIGLAKNIQIDGKRMLFEPVFHEITALARNIKDMFEEGILKTFSVGFIRKLKRDKEGNALTDKAGDYIIDKLELLEISAVAVPANPSAAVIQRGIDGVKNNEVKEIKEWVDCFDVKNENKAVVNFKKHPLASKEQAWDGPVEVRKATVDGLKLMSTWFDAKNSDIKGAYKLPHHKALDPHKTVWRGVAAAMAALLGARGGVKIPTAERRGVYNHLSKHYKEFNEKPPEFKDFRLADLYKMHKKGVIAADKVYLLAEMMKHYKNDNKKIKNIIYELLEITNGKKINLKGRELKVEENAEHHTRQIILRALQNVAKDINFALNKFKKQ